MRWKSAVHIGAVDFERRGISATDREDWSTMADQGSQPEVLGLLDLIATNLASFQSQTEANFISLRADVGALRGELVRVRDDVGDLRSDVSALQSDVSVLKSDVSVLKSDVSVLKSDVSVLKSDVSEIRETMAEGFARIEKRLDLIEAS